MQESYTQMTKWKQQIGKGYVSFDSNSDILENMKLVTVKRSAAARGRELGRDEQAELRGLLGQWNYSVWYCYDGCKSLHICPNQ